MGVLLSIGDFSRMTHLSIKALRHYHDVGLLAPADIDAMTGYRSYDAGQVPVAQVIRRLRDLGMSLGAVKTVLEAPNVEARNVEIVAHLQRMERELEQTQATVASLRGLLEAPPRLLPVVFRSIPAMAALGVRAEVTVEDFAPWWVSVFDELYGAIRAAGASPAGPGGALYPGEFFELAVGEVTVFVPVQGSPGGSGRVERLEIPEAEVAVMVHEGPLEDLDQTYGALGTTVAERAIGVGGPIREYYLVSFSDTDDQTQHRTEVCWPVFQTVTGGASGP